MRAAHSIASGLCCLAIAVAGLATPDMALAAPESRVVLAPEELRKAAVLALRQDDNPRALGYANALLSRNPDDRNALLIKSRAARALGDFDMARDAAAQAWDLASSEEQKYAAALIMAQALASDNSRTLAQFWLRRAVEHAPNPALSRRAIRDFRYVRARNPWLHRLSFSVTPDSNINNGSSERSSFLNYQLSEVLLGQPVEYQLGGRQQALSGIEYALGVRSRYRFRETATRAHDLAFTVDLRSYTLSSEAKSLAPGAKGSDFAFSSYTLGYGQRGLNFDRRGEYRLSVDLGQSWYSGTEYARFARVSAGQTYRMDRGRKVNVRFAAERQIGITRSDSDTLKGDFSYSFRLKSGATLWTNLTLAQASSSLAADEFSEVGLRSQLTLAKPLFGATAHFGLWARSRDYDVSPHSRSGRQDEKLEADITLVFNKIDYYGFNPTMRLTASRVDSNIALYQAQRFGLNFGIQSAF